MYFVCRQSTGKQKQRLHHQVSQIEGETIQIPADSEIFKNQEMTAAASISVTGEIDFGNVDLTQMDPEVIRVIHIQILSFTIGFSQLSALKN